MSKMKFAYSGRTDELWDSSNFGSCCGSSYYEGSTPAKPERRWKNQFGEGVKPATPEKTVVVDMVARNTRGLLLVPGKQDTKKKVDGFELKTIKTRNGPVSVSVRTVW